MANRESPTPQIDPELLEFLNGPPPQDGNGIDLSVIRENLKLTMEQRADRFYQPRRFIESLKTSRISHGPIPSVDSAAD